MESLLVDELVSSSRLASRSGGVSGIHENNSVDSSIRSFNHRRLSVVFKGFGRHGGVCDAADEGAISPTEGVLGLDGALLDLLSTDLTEG